MTSIAKIPFSPVEQEILLTLVNTYDNIINNNKTDSKSNVKKNAAWEDIAEQFNSSPNITKRTVGQLKKKYDNIKQNAKKKASQEKLYRMGTGGGGDIINNTAGTDSNNESLIISSITRELEFAPDSDALALVAAGDTSNFIVDQETGCLLPSNRIIQLANALTETRNREPNSSVILTNNFNHEPVTNATTSTANQLPINQIATSSRNSASARQIPCKNNTPAQPTSSKNTAPAQPPANDDNERTDRTDNTQRRVPPASLRDRAIIREIERRIEREDELHELKKKKLIAEIELVEVQKEKALKM